MASTDLARLYECTNVKKTNDNILNNNEKLDKMEEIINKK